MNPSPQQADLLRRANEALARRDIQAALSLIDQAETTGAGHPALMARAMALKVAGDPAGALRALDRALALQPYDFVALLGKAALLEQQGHGKQAVGVYRNALKIAPDRDRLPPPLVAQLEHAERRVAEQAQALAAHMRAEVSGLTQTLDPAVAARFQEGLDVYAGIKPPVKQEPLLLHYPELPVISFYDRSLFPWLETLEAATPMIQAELKAVLETRFDRFAPYIAFPPDVPANQWADLNHSEKWTAIFLWKDGLRQDALCDLCPGTAALLESLPICRQNGFAPTVTFSALQAGAHIPPHTGSANTRLLCHLPLILPGPARFRVGNTTREWKMGEAWVFDDTVEHEAWNDADALRVIMIIDVWNPYLTEAEKPLITAMMQAQSRFMAD